MSAAANDARDRQLWDALGELGNIGVGRGVSALAAFVGDATLGISPPELDRRPPPRGEVVVRFDLEGLETGAPMLVALELQSAGAAALEQALVGQLGWSGPIPSAEVAAMRDSALAEAGNVMVSAMANAMGRLLGVTLLPSPPTLSRRGSIADPGPPRRWVASSFFPLPQRGSPRPPGGPWGAVWLGLEPGHILALGRMLGLP